MDIFAVDHLTSKFIRYFIGYILIMQDPPPLPYLTEKVSKNYDVSLEVMQIHGTLYIYIY